MGCIIIIRDNIDTVIHLGSDIHIMVVRACLHPRSRPQQESEGDNREADMGPND